MGIKEIKQLIAKKFAKIFLSEITFYGRYSDNLQDLQKWFDSQALTPTWYDKRRSKVMVQSIYHESIKYEPIGKANLIDRGAQMLMIERMNSDIKKHLRKEKKMYAFYFDNNFVTRMLGLTPKEDHFRLKRVYDSVNDKNKLKRHIEKMKREKI